MHRSSPRPLVQVQTSDTLSTAAPLRSRISRDSHGEAYRRQVINGFLEEPDALASMEGVLLVGTCNDPAAIGPAVLRPGRLDIQVKVPRPGRDGYPSLISPACRAPPPDTRRAPSTPPAPRPRRGPRRAQAGPGL